jgi:thioesterase domain-containing protein
MKITDLPFNQLVGVKVSEESEYHLTLLDKKDYTNHLGTVHASALYALAEATSGHFLMINFPEFQTGIIPVLRQSDVKYKKPANGRVNATAVLLDNTIESIKEELTTKKRALLKLKVNLCDTSRIQVFSGVFEWFVVIVDRDS